MSEMSILIADPWRLKI